MLSKSSPRLTWSHYLVLLRVDNVQARAWYEKEASDQGWSVRTLDRNVSTLHYDRLVMSSDKMPVVAEMEKKTFAYQRNRLEFIKNPVIAEFLDVPQDKSFLESGLEQAIITSLSEFLMELGKGYAFVARQQHASAYLREEALQRDEHQRRMLPQRGNIRGSARGDGKDEIRIKAG